MKVEDIMKWNTRGAALYALGMWTILGAVGFMKYTGRLKDLPVEEVEEPENPNRHVFQSKHVKTVIIMKEDSAQYSTRFNRFIKSFTDQTNAPQECASSSNGDGDATDTRAD